MLLYGTEACKAERMLLVELLGEASEPGVARVVGAPYVAVAPLARTHQRHAPALVGHTRRNVEGNLIGSIIAHLVRDASASLLIQGLGDDVDGTTHTGCAHLRSSQSALRLHDFGHIADAGPIAPIDGSVLHVVHGHTVHHRRHIRVVETAHVYLRVAPAAALLVGVHARCRLHDFGELLSTQFLFYLLDGHIGQRYGCLAVEGHSARHRYAFQGHFIGFQSQGAHLTAFGYRELLCLETQIAYRYFAASVGIAQAKIAIGIRRRTCLFSNDTHLRPYQWLARIGIHQHTLHCCLSHSHRSHRQQRRQHKESCSFLHDYLSIVVKICCKDSANQAKTPIYRCFFYPNIHFFVFHYYLFQKYCINLLDETHN